MQATRREGRVSVRGLAFSYFSIIKQRLVSQDTGDQERSMGAPNNLTTTVEVCEDTDKTFNLVDLLIAAGYTPTAPVELTQILVTNPDGSVSSAPTSLVRISNDSLGLTITASNEADWFGSLSTLNVVVEVGVQTFTVRVNVTVLPVNDAPEGADRTVALTDGAGYILKEDDFGFRDPVEGDNFKSVVVTSVPAAGALLLNGVVLAAGAEVSVEDIRAGALVYMPPAAGAGPVGFDFQVRDDGGTANCGAADLDPSPNRITFEPALGSIGDRVWFDANGNGVQDGSETGVSGVTVLLTGAGADGQFGTADDIGRTTTTNSTGNYLFSNLAAGQYRVTFNQVAGYEFTKANAGGNDATDSDVNASGVSHVVTLGIAQSDLTVDAGISRLVGTGKIGDRVWFDYGSGSSYHNGLQDGNENSLPYFVANVKVTLHDAGTGNVLQTTYTDDYGKYLFSGLNAGNYYVQFDKSDAVFYSAYHQEYRSVARQSWTAKDVGTNDAVDSDVRSTHANEYELRVSRTDSFYLAQGATDLTRDAGITPIVIDLDGNGIETVARGDSAATFDLFGNGSPVQSGWISGGDGFLAVDLNGNGRIDDIGELFGGNAKGAGFAKLASFDSDGDGLVDARDDAFGELRIWVDANGNRQTDAGELRTLAEAGITALKVDYVEQPFLDAQGNLHLERSSATMADGRVVDMTDVYFNVDAADALAAGVELPTMGELLGVDNAPLDHLLGAQPTGGQNAVGTEDFGFDVAGEAQRMIAEAMRQAEATLSAVC